MDGDKVGGAQQIIQRQQVYADGGGAAGRNERIICDDAHLQALGLGGNQAANTTEPHQAQHLVAYLNTLEVVLLPATRFERAHRRDQLACQRKDHGNRVFSNGIAIAGRCVDHQDAALGGRLDVDIVDTRSGTPHHAQPSSGLEQSLIHLGRAADNEGIVLGQDLTQLLVRKVQLDVDLGMLVKIGHAGITQSLRHKDPHHPSRQHLQHIQRVHDQPGQKFGVEKRALLRHGQPRHGHLPNLIDRRRIEQEGELSLTV